MPVCLQQVACMPYSQFLSTTAVLPSCTTLCLVTVCCCCYIVSSFISGHFIRAVILKNSRFPQDARKQCWPAVSCISPDAECCLPVVTVRLALLWCWWQQRYPLCPVAPGLKPEVTAGLQLSSHCLLAWQDGGQHLIQLCGTQLLILLRQQRFAEV